MNKSFEYRQWKVSLSWNRYMNGRPQLTLLDVEDGCPVAVATVNIPEEELGPKEVIIKDYSENVGMLRFLQSNGIVGEVKRWVSQGYVSCPVVEISETFFNPVKHS